LQSALNAAARLIFHLRRSDHVTDALVSLHWLRVPERIQFKIAVLTYRVLHGDAPRYLGPFTSTADVPGWRALRSAGTKRLVCLQLDFLPSAAELFRSPPLKSGTLYRNTSSQPLRCSPSGVIWRRFYYNNLSVYSTLVDLVVILVNWATLKNHWLIDWYRVVQKRIPRLFWG